MSTTLPTATESVCGCERSRPAASSIVPLKEIVSFFLALNKNVPFTAAAVIVRLLGGVVPDGGAGFSRADRQRQLRRAGGIPRRIGDRHSRHVDAGLRELVNRLRALNRGRHVAGGIEKVVVTL